MKLVNLFLASVCLLFIGCEASDEPEIVVCPIAENQILVLAVDYTTHDFKGGYVVGLPTLTSGFEMVAEYNSPGDFGDITWYEKSTETKLFAGTIIWMGKGEQTFPEEMISPTSFAKVDNAVEMPALIFLSPSEYIKEDPETDYKPIWEAVSNLQFISWLPDSKEPVYIYLYQPSVGVGDPADWYWLIFMKY